VAETDSVLFHGGPCNGRTEQRLVSDLRDGKVACLRTIYDAHRIDEGAWLAVLPGVKINPQASPVTAPKATRAWNRMLHSMRVGVPTQMARTRAARTALLRSGRR
jgi:hypothetical protein